MSIHKIVMPAAVALLALFSGVAMAASGAGQVQFLSGTLSVQKPDGSVRILSQKSQVNPGDTLTTQKDSFAQVNFTDGSSMTMRPNSRMKIEAYQFAQDKPNEDSVFFRLLKGGLRTVTGLIGKRGNQDAYKIGTSTATIGIRGSSGDDLDCTQGCDGVVEGGDKLQKGTYHTTYTGSYVMENGQGSVVIGEGQFGFVGQSGAPVILPGDPGLKLQDLPFTLGVSQGGGGECVVR